MLNTKWKTVRECELEAKVNRLEQALYRAKYNCTPLMPTESVIDSKPPPRITVPLAASIRTFEDPGLPTHMGVAARVWTRKPFGLNYYVNAGLLTDERIAARVLGLEHERFIRQLVHFITHGEKKENDADDKRLPPA